MSPADLENDDEGRLLSLARGPALLVAAAAVFVVAEFFMLLMLGFAAQGDDGLTPDQTLLTVVSIVWGVLTLATATLALLGARTLQRRGVIPWLPLSSGAALWILVSGIAVAVLAVTS